MRGFLFGFGLSVLYYYAVVVLLLSVVCIPFASGNTEVRDSNIGSPVCDIDCARITHVLAFT